MVSLKSFVGIALIINVLALFFVPFTSDMFNYLIVSGIVLGIIWGIAKWL